MSARQQFIDRIQDDFTYKGDFSKEQTQLYQQVEDYFDIASVELGEAIPSVKSISAEDQIREGQRLLRKAHRRANAAIANDFDASDDSKEKVRIREHPKEVVESVRQSQCHLVTCIFYDLATALALTLPLGRPASVVHDDT